MKNKENKSKRIPFNKSKLLFALLLLALTSINIWLLHKVSFIFEPLEIIFKTVMFPTTLAGIFYFLFVPVVDHLETKKIKRVYSIFGLFLVVIGSLALTFSYIIPTMIRQTKEFFLNLPTWWENVKIFISDYDLPSWLDKHRGDIDSYVEAIPTEFFTWTQSYMAVLPDQVFPVVGAVTGVITVLITTPFVLFYLLKDGRKLLPFFVSFLPPSYQKKTDKIAKEMASQISSFIRGQMIVSFCIGVLLFIGYTIIGMPYALTLAIVAALTSVVPYLGPTIAITPAILVSLFTDPTMVIKLIVVWTAVQLIEGKLITPQVMGKSIHVHPITIIFVILISGKLFGALGMIIAIPGYAVIKVVVKHIYVWIKGVAKIYQEKEDI